MLETVKTLLQTDTGITFNEYYQRYINDIQNYSLGYEVDGLKKMDLLDINKLLDKLYKEIL